LTLKVISSPTSAVMLLGVNVRAGPTSTVIVFAAAILTRPKVPRRERFKSIVADNDFGLGLGGGLKLTTD